MRIAAVRKFEPMISIVPTTTEHIEELSQTMREQDAHEAVSLGYNPGELLKISYDSSLMRKTALVNGRVAACWGVCGMPMGYTGRPWLVTSDEVYNESAFTYALIYREEVKKMAEIFPVLENYVETEYTQSVRLLKLIGFHINEPIPLGVNGELFTRFVWVKNAN